MIRSKGKSGKTIRSGELSIIGPKVRADWYEAGEGYCGDYNPEDPEDEELLRFDIYQKREGSDDWEEVDDASYCTMVPADTGMDKLKELLFSIYMLCRCAGRQSVCFREENGRGVKLDQLRRI